MSDKVDFRKTLGAYYNPPKGPFHLIDVPSMNFLMLDGRGDPNKSLDYQLAIEALYSLSYGIKFAQKAQGVDYIVPPLEGLWWMENMNEFSLANKDRWEWTMMIMQPQGVTLEVVDKVRKDKYKKKKNEMLQKIRFEKYHEGLSVQVLYTGAYRNEGPTIAEMHRFINDNGYRMHGKHHEVYLSDIRKTSADKLQTVLRQPISKG